MSVNGGVPAGPSWVVAMLPLVSVKLDLMLLLVQPDNSFSIHSADLKRISALELLPSSSHQEAVKEESGLTLV